MSRKGNGWDNAVAERCFRILKTELIYLAEFKMHEQPQTGVFEYIAVIYNRQCWQAANGSLAPLAYEQAFNTHAMLCPEQC
jgi:transposase InsO family protein